MNFLFLGTYVSRLLGFFLFPDLILVFPYFSKELLIFSVFLACRGCVTPVSVYHVTRFINGEELAV